MQSRSSYAANLSTLCWLLCAQSHVTALQDVPAHTALIGGAPSGTLLRLDPSCYDSGWRKISRCPTSPGLELYGESRLAAFTFAMQMFVSVNMF